MKYYQTFLWSLILHKSFVFRAGRALGVPVWRLIVHDWSKFTLAEFPHYARKFGGYVGNEDEVKTAFAYAWLHHKNTNPHHWDHWVATGGKPLEMPETYVREMIADWHGAGRGYQGSWDISPWLNGQLSKMNLHPQTLEKVINVMHVAGYFRDSTGVWHSRKPLILRR